MTSIYTLILYFAIAGAILTFLTRAKSKNLLLSFLQHFTGVWFAFSGIVKAIDPIGTAYKMEEYFGHFETTFAGLVKKTATEVVVDGQTITQEVQAPGLWNSLMAGLADLFPWLAGYSMGFSIFMITLEIVLGVMLIIGYQRRAAAWLFFLIVVFFTILTGFTFTTGYVPPEANYFDFAKWGPYVKSYMRATDCGCFGDFIKLDPKISFFKDVALLIPAFIFIWGWKRAHQLFTSNQRKWIFIGTTALTLLFCYRNAWYDNPIVDFRPFKTGANIRERKALEASAKIDVLGWVLQNTNTGETVKFMEPEPGKITYYKQYPKDQGWKVKEQIQSELYVMVDGKREAITKTKVSEFVVEDNENGEVSDDLLNETGYSLMIVPFHFEGNVEKQMISVQDTTWKVDTVHVSKDSMHLIRNMAGVTSRQIEREVFVPDAHYADIFANGVNPIAAAAQKAGWKVYAISTISDAKWAADLKVKTGADYPFYRGDDKLLKTITRSNPGLVILKDGVVKGHYHWRHLPKPDQLIATFQ